MNRSKPKQAKAPWYIAMFGTNIARRPWKRVNPVSVRRQAEAAAYCRQKKKFLAARPACEVCVALDAKPRQRSNQVHHRRGRKGSNYLNEATWMAVCPGCHDRIHREPAWAKEHGFLGSFHH